MKQAGRIRRTIALSAPHGGFALAHAVDRSRTRAGRRFSAPVEQFFENGRARYCASRSSRQRAGSGAFFWGRAGKAGAARLRLQVATIPADISRESSANDRDGRETSGVIRETAPGRAAIRQAQRRLSRDLAATVGRRAHALRRCAMPVHKRA